MPLNREEQKEAFKEAIREWMDDQFATFGRWTFYGLTAAALGAVVILILKSQGWAIK